MLAACAEAPPLPADTPALSKIQTLPPQVASSGDVDTFATEVLNSIQGRSIRESREYCGFIVRRPDGILETSRILPGGEDFCEIMQSSQNVIASFHTHGSYSPRYDNEVPSLNDALSDIEAGTDGYVSTPGGRVWRIDHETRIIEQLCGLGCVTSDPRNNTRHGAPVPNRFTLGQLRARFS